MSMKPESRAPRPEGMSDARLAEIAAREARATAGPWLAKRCDPPWRREGELSDRCDGISPAHNHSDHGECREHLGCPAQTEIVTTDSGVYGPRWPDAEFIAHSRTDVPDLLAEVSRLRADGATLRERVGQLPAEFCQSEGPRGETICMMQLGHAGPCGWEKLAQESK